MLETVSRLGDALRRREWMAATAESCTGGLLASMLTDVSGSSDWFLGSLVTYSNEMKESILGVPATIISKHGAVSRETVSAMARGLLLMTGADIGVAVSGIAGPTGGTPDKPVGTVWMAWAWPGGERAEKFLFNGSRTEIKEQTVRTAIEGLLAAVR